jgi:hypothetical protein
MPVSNRALFRTSASWEALCKYREWEDEVLEDEVLGDLKRKDLGGSSAK